MEKLCHRFRACPDSPRQWRDLSYCLSLFPFSDKAVRRLQDNFGCFSDKLHDEAVHQAFSGEGPFRDLIAKCGVPWLSRYSLGNFLPS